MNEKRFTFDDEVEFEIFDKETGQHYDGRIGHQKTLCILLNEQQASITNLQGEVERLKYIIDELRKDNYKRFEKINELKAKLKEKEEDEKLYANEILELRETNKEFIQFKELGGDY